MSNVEILDATRDANGGYKVDVGRGQRIGRVSSEWFSRPDDERFLSLSELFASVNKRSERSRTRTVETAAIRVEASGDNAERLSLILPGAAEPVLPTHWSFGQLASLVGAPAAYLRQLPAALAGINLQRPKPPIEPSRSRRSRPMVDASISAPSPVRTMAGSMITNWSRQFSGSPAMAPATRDGRCRGRWIGRPASIIPRSM